MRAVLVLSVSCCVAALRRVAIVTGGTRGIGLAIAHGLAESGHDLLLNYVSDSRAAKRAADELHRAHGCRVVCVRGDLSYESTRERIFDEYDAQFGNGDDECCLASVVHNAGQYLGLTAANDRGLPPAPEMALGDGSMLRSPDGFRSMHFYQALYGDAYVDLCERAIERMRATGGGGSLVGISSPGCSLLYKPNAGYDLPGAGKCIMEYANRLLALRAARWGISSNVVIPGFTPTTAWDHLARAVGSSDMAQSLATRLSPSGRCTRPEDVAAVVAFLCSDAGRTITGVSLPADGGVHLRI